LLALVITIIQVSTLSVSLPGYQHPQQLTQLKLSTYISNSRTTIGILQLGQIIDAHRQLNISWCSDDAKLLNA
jgi:hypothetical protein